MVALTTVSPGCSEPAMPETSLDDLAESFVKLALALGQHDQDYVDAYFGPESWREAVEEDQLSLAQIIERAEEQYRQIEAVPLPSADQARLRQRQLRLARGIEALAARARVVSGEAFTFDEESRAIFDAVAPTYDAAHFEALLDSLDRALPGEGSLITRYSAFKEDFVIPADRLEPVFQAAIEACRDRTRQFIDLPDGESFEVEYVTGKSWSAYNWYKGGYHSLIQVNTDLPVYIDRALDLACHEGYPGHHVFNLLLEKNLLQDRGWHEFYVYPLFSPRSLIAEGTANFGIEVAFPAAERLRFEQEVLFPLAGLDARRVAEYYEVEELKSALDYAGNEAARGYLDGAMDQEAAIDWLLTYALMSEPRARQRLAFIEQYRTYVINYNLGQDMVRHHIESLGGTADQSARRWQLFAELLSDPLLPSQLQ